MSEIPAPPQATTHLEELTFLWRHRDRTMALPGARDADLATVEQRIEAQVHRLQVETADYVPWLASKLASDDAVEAFAAAFLLLRIDPLGPKAVAAALATAAPDKIEPLRKAVCYGPVLALADELDALAVGGVNVAAAVALEALARHRFGTPTRQQVAPFLDSPDPLVRQAGWRVVALMP